MSKYKNIGTKLRKEPTPTIAGSKDSKNLARYKDKRKRRAKTNLSRGAFGGL